MQVLLVSLKNKYLLQRVEMKPSVVSGYYCEVLDSILIFQLVPVGGNSIVLP